MSKNHTSGNYRSENPDQDIKYQQSMLLKIKTLNFKKKNPKMQ